LHDVVSTLLRRAPHVAVCVYPTLVQGSEAPALISAALETANRRDEVDLILLCRGGGSLEDLWAFNDERVVRAVVQSRLPVVCGVGHEIDVSLAELAADVRASTPTAAAELAAPSREALLQALNHQEGRLRQRLRQRLDTAAQRLDQTALRLQRPARVLAGQLVRLEALRERLLRAGRTDLRARQQSSVEVFRRLQRCLPLAVAGHSQRLGQLGDRLRLLDPRQVLQRGYAWVESADGRPVLSAHALEVGQHVRAVWADGAAQARVESVSPGLAASSAAPAKS
jgi:exodeoxyribonuclease VII large subunit